MWACRSQLSRRAKAQRCDLAAINRICITASDMVLLPGPVVILGDIFMSKYLSVFDRDADAVYIGKANQDSDKSMMFTDQPSDALLELDDVETDNWTEISAVSY